MTSSDAARDVIERGISARVFPAASVDVGDSSGSLWSEAFGSLTFHPGATPTTLHTPFDLASLTKVLATTPLVMDLVHAGRMRLDDRVSGLLSEWRGGDRDIVTVRDLLEHASGLPARLETRPPSGRAAMEREINRVPLEYRPRTRSLYSDLDFILLGFLVADCGGMSLAAQFDVLRQRLTNEQATLTFGLATDVKSLAAPVLPLPGDLRGAGVLVGEVQDDYAAALDGVAGHAGLFGSVLDVAQLARTVLRAARGMADGPPPFTPDLVRLFTTRSTVEGSSRALGWDTMLPTSSCGTRMSTAAFGHTGFTGTSLWIDPVRDRYFVLLTNRGYVTAAPDGIGALRRAFHDALGDL